MAKAGSKTKTTIDHDEIRRWVEEHHGRPTTADPPAEGFPGVLQIAFPERGNEAAIDELSWMEFFGKFEDQELAFIYELEPPGQATSHFAKFVPR